MVPPSHISATLIYLKWKIRKPDSAKQIFPQPGYITFYFVEMPIFNALSAFKTLWWRKKNSNNVSMWWCETQPPEPLEGCSFMMGSFLPRLASSISLPACPAWTLSSVWEWGWETGVDRVRRWRAEHHFWGDSSKLYSCCPVKRSFMFPKKPEIQILL